MSITIPHAARNDVLNALKTNWIERREALRLTPGTKREAEALLHFLTGVNTALVALGGPDEGIGGLIMLASVQGSEALGIPRPDKIERRVKA